MTTQTEITEKKQTQTYTTQQNETLKQYRTKKTYTICGETKQHRRERHTRTENRDMREEKRNKRNTNEITHENRIHRTQNNYIPHNKRQFKRNHK